MMIQYLCPHGDELAVGEHRCYKESLSFDTIKT